MASLIRLVVSNYNEILESNKDPMVDTWLFMGSPGPMLCIVGAYLVFVLKIGPKMMENRPAFQLNNLLIFYNAFQVVFSIWLSFQAWEVDIEKLLFTNGCPMKDHLNMKISAQTAVNIQRSVVVLFLQNHRTSRHGILRSTKEAKSGHFSSRLPSHHHRRIFLVLPQVITWRARCYSWFFEFSRSHCYVHLLLDSGTRTKIQEILMVEEIHDLYTIDPICHNAGILGADSRDGLRIAKSLDVFLRNERGDLHLSIQRFLSESVQEETNLTLSVHRVTPKTHASAIQRDCFSFVQCFADKRVPVNNIQGREIQEISEQRRNIVIITRNFNIKEKLNQETFLLEVTRESGNKIKSERHAKERKREKEMVDLSLTV